MKFMRHTSLLKCLITIHERYTWSDRMHTYPKQYRRANKIADSTIAAHAGQA